MTTRQRLYAKIMRNLDRRTGSGVWDYRTLRICHPQIASALGEILVAEGLVTWGNLPMHYLPRRIGNVRPSRIGNVRPCFFRRVV